MYRVWAEFVKKIDIFSCYFHIVIDINNLKIRCCRSCLYLTIDTRNVGSNVYTFPEKK